MSAAGLALDVTGIGAWLQGAPDWPSLRAVLRGESGLDGDAPPKPAAATLPAGERRRAPDSVRLAAEVAAQACAMAGRDPAGVPCVFSSTHGELAITDYVCETLAAAPLDLSPTKFHNSVLNAPAGYWTIATGCTAASSAISAHHRSFAAGLLEAAAFACAEDCAVLLACCDVASAGPLGEMTGTHLPFGAALLLSPATAGKTRAHIKLAPAGVPEPAPELVVALHDVARDNPANAQALALLAALAGDRPGRVALALSAGLSLEMEIAP